MSKNLYNVTFSVRGTVSHNFYAESDEEAKQIAEAMMNDEECEIFYDLETVDDVSSFGNPIRITSHGEDK